jgi:hypothetical protein
MSNAVNDDGGSGPSASTTTALPATVDRATFQAGLDILRASSTVDSAVRCPSCTAPAPSRIVARESALSMARPSAAGGQRRRVVTGDTRRQILLDQ